MSGTEYSFSDDDTQAAFIPTWDKDGLNVLVSVKDATIMIRMKLQYMWMRQTQQEM